MRRTPSGGGEHAAIGIAAALAAGLALVWLWGGVAGILFGHGWPELPASELLAVLFRLPLHLSDPQLAWPVPVRRNLPSGSLLLVCLAISAVLVGLSAVAVRALATAGRGAGRSDATHGARWASGHELRPLRQSLRGKPEAGRLALGRRHGRLLYAERRHALVAFGPPQSGKSAGLAIPALLEWNGPAIASSIKTDLVATTLERRRELGEVFVFDPFGLSGVRADTWSPLSSATTWEGALEVAWRMTAAGELDQRGVEGGDFWAVAAEQRLAPLLWAAAHSSCRMEQVVGWAYGQGARDLDDAIERAARSGDGATDRADARAAYEAVRAFDAQADRTRTSIEATVQALLRAYRFGRVARSAHGSEIDPARLLRSQSTLYLIGDAKASKLLRPIFLALLSEVVDRAYEHANASGGRLPLPLLVCLDEAGNVAPLPNLAEVASTAPSHNIQLVSIFHDIAQARARYGQQTETVVNSHRARMLLPGVADLETLRYFSGLVGDEEARELTRTTGAGGDSRSIARRRRPLIAAEALRQQAEGSALLVYGRLPPVRLRLRRWFDDRRLRRLAGTPQASARETEPHPGAVPRADPGTDPRAAPRADPGNDRGAESRADPGNDPGAESR